jgi:hypothetical protein
MEVRRPLVDRFEDDSTAIATYEDFILVVWKATRAGKSNSLTSTIAKELCSRGHARSIYRGIYARNQRLGTAVSA